MKCERFISDGLGSINYRICNNTYFDDDDDYQYYHENCTYFHERSKISCYDSSGFNGGVVVYYVNCIPVSTAVANALNYSVYLCIMASIAYIVIRACITYRGRLSYESFDLILNNDPKVQMQSTRVHSVELSAQSS